MKKTDTQRLVAWLSSGGSRIVVATFVMAFLAGAPGVVFAFLMMMVNGISLGITDQNRSPLPW